MVKWRSVHSDHCPHAEDLHLATRMSRSQRTQVWSIKEHMYAYAPGRLGDQLVHLQFAAAKVSLRVLPQMYQS